LASLTGGKVKNETYGRYHAFFSGTYGAAGAGLKENGLGRFFEYKKGAITKKVRSRVPEKGLFSAF